MAEYETFEEGWAILELLGHRRLGGFLREQEFAGGAFIRIDIPGDGDQAEVVATQLYAPAAVYCLTPCSEEAARVAAAAGQPQPVHRWELPAALPAEETASEHDDEQDTW